MTGPSTDASRRTAGPRTVVTVVLFAIGVGCAAAAGPVYRAGVVPGGYPSYIANAAGYQVDRFSGPWIAAGLALAAAALVLFCVAVARWRRSRLPVPG